MSTEIQDSIDTTLKNFVRERFLPALIRFVPAPSNSVEAVLTRTFWLESEGEFFQLRQALYGLAEVRNPRRLDAFQAPWVRRELEEFENLIVTRQDLLLQLERFVDLIVASSELSNPDEVAVSLKAFIRDVIRK